MHDPDPRSIERARAGDVGAFEDLVRACQADVYRFARQLTRDPAMAEDVTQDAFLRAYRFLDTFRGDCRFSSWLLRITRNCAMDALRARTRRAERELAGPPPSPVTEAATRAELTAALEALEPAHREPFLLIEVFGLSYREAADVLDLALGTVKSRMHRARRTMCAALADEDAADEV